jgi:hypothetical protein
MARVPMHKFGKLKELVGAAVFLVSDAASCVTGHLLVVAAECWQAALINEPSPFVTKMRLRIRHAPAFCNLVFLV